MITLQNDVTQQNEIYRPIHLTKYRNCISMEITSFSFLILQRYHYYVKVKHSVLWKRMDDGFLNFFISFKSFINFYAVNCFYNEIFF